MRVDKPDDYKLLGFRVSYTKNKKYDAILQHKDTKEFKFVPYGDSSRQHFRDKTGLGYYTFLNHNDDKRRLAFRKRFAKDAQYKFSSAYFAYHYLW